MGTEIEVRLATERDALEIARLSRDHIEQGLGWSWTQARVLGAIRSAETNVAVIEAQGVVLAFGIMDYLAEHAHLALLAVRPSHRRQGLASKVLAWLEEAARIAGAERIVLECRRGNDAARCLYLEHGYHERVIEQAMYGGVEDGIRLEKWLRARRRRIGAKA